jgi:hypothetical protein
MLGLLWEPDISPPAELVQQLQSGGKISADEIHPSLFLPFVNRSTG